MLREAADDINNGQKVVRAGGSKYRQLQAVAI
jgi:hypothetical protein